MKIFFGLSWPRVGVSIILSRARLQLSICAPNECARVSSRTFLSRQTRARWGVIGRLRRRGDILFVVFYPPH